jgi:SDR family mycofactocin-dependent oxidoreductase
MTGKLEGKVAFITGAARGQGRSHAVRLAQEGADIIAAGICRQTGTVRYPMAAPQDLDQTVKQVEALDRRIVATQAGVRDYDAVKAGLDEGVAQPGRLDIVCANAGIGSRGRLEETDEQTWQDMIDVNLTGYWHAAKAAIPHLRAGGRGGSIILTSSVAGLKALQNMGHYVPAKHGVVGLMRTLALELAPDMIRVNSVNPASVNTDMIQNAAEYALFAPDLPAGARTGEAVIPRFQQLNALPIPWAEPVDISNAVLWLASDESRYVTGITLPVEILMSEDMYRQALLRHLVRAREEERARIAAGIHDDVIQMMSAASLRLQQLKLRIHDPVARQVLEQLQDALSLTLSHLRQVIYDLRPPGLEDGSLGAALRVYLEQMHSETGIACRLDDRLSARVPDSTALLIYRTVREALANVRQHARASTVTVGLLDLENGCLARIADDGAGYDPAGIEDRPGHLGLALIRERAELAGGWCRIESSPGSGTTVEFWVPSGESLHRAGARP